MVCVVRYGSVSLDSVSPTSDSKKTIDVFDDVIWSRGKRRAVGKQNG